MVCVAFVKQANIAENQQINNGQPKDVDKSRARKSKKQQNELLEEKDGEWLDGGTKATTSSTDTALETVGAVNGAKE